MTLKILGFMRGKGLYLIFSANQKVVFFPQANEIANFHRVIRSNLKEIEPEIGKSSKVNNLRYDFVTFFMPLKIKKQIT